MSVDINTSELGFKRPFTREVTQILVLKNPNHGPVVFKVKTTAPKHYCVRPNHGRIEAGKEVEVQVLLQAMKEDLPADVRSKDKFLVQSVAITADQEFDNMAEVWQQVEKISKGSIHEKKIRVNFLPADGEANGTSRNSLAPPPNSSPSGGDSAAATPSRSTGAEDTSHTPAMKTPATQSQEQSRSDPATPPRTSENETGAAGLGLGGVTGVAASSSVGGSSTTATESTPSSDLRQRKPMAAAASEIKDTAQQAKLALQQAQPDGVPVNIVFVLCLLSFLIGYIFF